MQASVIRRQYDEIISSHYDFDPQSVLGDSLGRAMRQIRRQEDAGGGATLRTLDLGLGTGRFLGMLRGPAGLSIQPFGLDISAKMLDIARERVPDLVAAVDDAANLDAHFPDVSFDLVCTHFMTGFVPLGVLAPKIHARMERGGLWSFVGGTMAGFPALQARARSRLVRWLLGIKETDPGRFVCNPAGEAEVVDTLRRNGFTVRECETFRPRLHFRDFNEFMEFAYYGGWLTGFLEGLGLHKARPVLKAVLNRFLFPVEDHHNIVIALARKE